MPRVAALYRYPVKGLTPESRESLMLLPDGRVAGDRVLGVRFAGTRAGDDAWSSKHGMVVLMNTPGLARLQVRFDEAAERLRIGLEDRVLSDEPLSLAGRKRIADVLTEYVSGLEENPLSGYPERLPLRIVGDGRTPRYHDSQAGYVSLHARESVAALTAVLRTQVSELRFRSNIAIEGVDAWEEQTWGGCRLHIGSVEFDVLEPRKRCLATHANPQTGERDLPVMTTLVSTLGTKEPMFGVMMLPRNPGEIHVGDEVRVL